MSDPVTAALARIAAARGGSFAIVSDRSRANLYAQFVAADGEAGLYGELVGNAYLPSSEQLTGLQQADLRARGWAGDGEANWSRTWADASTEEARRAIALEALGALRDVYGASGDVEVEVSLEAPAVAASRSPAAARRGVLLVALALLVLAFGAALFVFLSAAPPTAP